MKTIQIPINEKQYENAINFLETEKPDIVILNTKMQMELSVATSYPLVGGTCKEVAKIADKFYDYIKKNFEVYSIYTPAVIDDYGREIKKAMRHMSLIDKIKLNFGIDNIRDVLWFLAFTTKLAFYGFVLRKDKKTGEMVEEFFEKFEKEKFRVPLMNTIGKALAFESKLLKKEIKKIIDENKKKKIVYVGDKKDTVGLDLNCYVEI